MLNPPNLNVALLQLEQARYEIARLEQTVGVLVVERAKLRLALDRYEPRPEPEISTFGT